MRPRYHGCCFDQRLANSYRSRIYPAYKANREPTRLTCCSSSSTPAGVPHLGLRWFTNPSTNR